MCLFSSSLVLDISSVLDTGNLLLDSFFRSLALDGSLV